MTGWTSAGQLARLREDIIVQYARVGPNGRPSRCVASATGGGKPKVIFPTMAAATTAEQELAAKALSIRHTVYPCPYGNHSHLTKRGGGRS